MTEHPMTAALADLRGAHYEVETTPDERRAIDWTLHILGDPEIAEVFHRYQFTGGQS